MIQWNRILLGILNTPGAQPATIHATRSLAIMHAAIYDAVDSIERTSAPYLVSIRSARRASPDAAAAAAGYTVLANLYPGQQETLAAEFASSLAQVPDGSANRRRPRRRRRRERAARDSQRRRLGRRAADLHAGHAARRLPADTARVRAAGVHAVGVRPPVRAASARASSGPGRRRRVTSKAYADAFQEVKSLGAVGSTTRTADQTQIAQFWNPPIWIAWNNIAETAALAHHDTLVQDARLFALLNLTLRRLDDRLLRRQVHLRLLAAGDRDPRRRHRRQPGHRRRSQLDAARDRPRRIPPTRAPTP